MVKVEYHYNPYLLETTILFNGRSPKINSQIEKYNGSLLQDWLEQLPQICHDEMNGYDFDVDFSGTVLEFQQLQAIFQAKGVSKELVRFHLKRTLESSLEKVARLNDFENWLATTPNATLMSEELVAVLGEVDRNCRLLTLFLGQIPDGELGDVVLTFEKHDHLSELPEDITHLPIIICVTVTNHYLIADVLRSLLQRPDVSAAQLFFVMEEGVPKELLKQTLMDLKLPQTQVLTTLKDEVLTNYLYHYGINDVTRKRLTLVRDYQERMMSQLAVLKESSDLQHRESSDVILGYEKQLDAMKRSLECFLDKENFYIEGDWQELEASLEEAIRLWNRKKTVLMSDDDAILQAEAFQTYLQKVYQDCQSELIKIFRFYESKMANDFREFYARAAIDDGFEPHRNLYVSLGQEGLSDLKELFLKTRKEQFVEKNDFMQVIFNGLKQKPQDYREMVAEVRYSLQDWRVLAKHDLLDKLRAWEAMVEAQLKDYYEVLSKRYEEHLEDLIRVHQKQKEERAAGLSEEAQAFQLLQDWIGTLNEKLEIIERA